MSRSYKKTPGFGDTATVGKRFANHKVRRYRGWIPNGGTYKRFYDQWNIKDYDWRYYSRSEVERTVEKWNNYYRGLGYDHEYSRNWTSRDFWKDCKNPEKHDDYVYRYYMK